MRLKDAGLEHVQISIQDSDKEIAERIAGTRSWDAKLQAAAWIKELDFAFTVNVVLHRANLDHLAEIIDMAGALGADRIELANTQYYGWAVLNRESLMPTRAQIERSEAIVDRAVEKYRGTMQIIYVLPDYYSEFPKPCQGGWGNFYLVVAPDGRTMPCHAASQITTLSFDNVRDRSMRWIWEESSAFRAFRGDEWMKEPCRSCPRKHVDFGGCRCQAFALTGDATRTDPVCTLTPIARSSTRCSMASHRRCTTPIARWGARANRRPRSRDRVWRARRASSAAALLALEYQAHLLRELVRQKRLLEKVDLRIRELVEHHVVVVIPGHEQHANGRPPVADPVDHHAGI